MLHLQGGVRPRTEIATGMSQQWGQQAQMRPEEVSPDMAIVKAECLIPVYLAIQVPREYCISQSVLEWVKMRDPKASISWLPGVDFHSPP